MQYAEPGRLNGNTPTLAATTATGQEMICSALRIICLLYTSNGQAIFPAQLVAHVPYAVIAPFVGIIFAVVYEIYGAENNVIVDVSFVNVRREY